MWLSVLCGMLLLLCGGLLFQRYHWRRDIRKMCAAAEAIRRGNLNLRFRLHNPGKETEALSAELNRLTGGFQDSMARIHDLEEERRRMISNISHDLRTPLTSLLGYIEALRDDDSLTEEERASFLHIAAEKGGDLSLLIQAVFELARLEEDQEELVLAPVDMAELARSVLLDFYHDFLALTMAPVTRLPEGALMARGNEEALRRVLRNLIANALRYGADGGEIGVTARQEGSVVWVEVWDTGKGIPAKELPYVFDRFYRGTPWRSGSGGVGGSVRGTGGSFRGTGLGLTIAKTLMERQGGQIRAESDPGEKTVFAVGLQEAMSEV